MATAWRCPASRLVSIVSDVPHFGSAGREMRHRATTGAYLRGVGGTS